MQNMRRFALQFRRVNLRLPVRSLSTTMEEEIKGTIATVDLSCLQKNYTFAKSLGPNSKTMAVIKANAYGHGDIRAAEALMEVNVDGIGVANVYEAVHLRMGGISDVNTLLVLQGAQNESDWELAKAHNLTLMIQNQVQLDYALGANVGKDQPIWIKCDTGMHRVGLAPEYCTTRLPEVIEKFGLSGFVFCSHFASSDEVGLDFNMEQLAILKDIQQRFGLQWSMANSGGILSLPESHGTWNRAGYMLYGNSPLSAPHPNDAGLHHVMTFTAPVIALRNVPVGESVGYSRKWYAERPSRIATVAIGYADGYPRHAPSGTPVFINGKRFPLAGRVSMDMITIDVTDADEEVSVGDEVCLWGRDKYGNLLSVNEVAEHAGTIGYELLTKVTSRPRKVYVSSYSSTA